MCVLIQFQKEARDTQDLVNRLDKELDQKYNPEFKDVYQVEGLIDEIDVCVFTYLFIFIRPIKIFSIRQTCRNYHNNGSDPDHVLLR